MAGSTAISNIAVSYSINILNISNDIQQELGKVNGEAEGSRIAKSLGSGIKAGLLAAGQAIMSTLGDAFSSGVDQLSALDVVQAKMRGLGNDSAAVAKATDNAFAAVQGTAFGVGDAAGVAGQLMAANVAPGQELERVLKTVGSSAAAAGTDFGSMGAIFAGAASQMGGVQNDVLSDLEGRGIPVYKALADQLGVTTDEVFKMAADGKISFEAFEQAASSASGAISTEMAGTASGSFDTMMASLDRLAITIMEDVFPLVAPVFQEIARWLDEAAVQVKPLAEAFGTWLKGALEAASTAVKNLGKWLEDNYTWVSPIAAAIGGAALAFGAWSLAIKGWALATRAAAAVQLLYNAALAANPIMLIVMAIAALVAGLVWFFTQTDVGKNAWEQFTGFLSEAWANVSGFFQQVWETVLKPIFDGIAAVVTWVFESILQPAFLAVQTAFAVLAGVFQGIWEGFLKPVFDAIGAIFLWLWDTIIKIVIWYITTYIQVLSAVFVWLWEAILLPVFTAIGAIFNWIWLNVIQPIVSFIGLVIQGLGLLFAWLWEAILLPVFTAIGAIFNWIWLNVIQPIVFAIGLAIQTLGGIFNWLFVNVITPVWDGISNAIKFVWENGIKPVIDTISRVIQTDPKKAFEAARDAIGTAWSGIQELAKKPVRFVVNTVLNGLIDMINLIPGVNLAPIKLPKGFSEGGYTGNLAPTAVAGVVHGNEHVIRAASRQRIERTHPGLLDHMNRFGQIPGYAKGGLVNPLAKDKYSISQPYHSGHNGIDMAAPEGTPIMAAGAGIATNVGVVHMGGNEVRLQHPSGFATRYSHLSRFAVTEGQSVQQGHVIGYVGSTGMSTGPHLHYMVHTPPGGWNNMTDPAPYLDGSSKMLGEAWNPLAGLVDWVAGKVKDAFPEGGMWIDAAAGLVKDTAERVVNLFTPKIGADGSTSATLYDSGGWLQPGLSLVENRTGRPEPILTGSQWDDIGRLLLHSGQTGGTRIEINGNVGWDPAELAAETERRQQRQNALAGIGDIR